MLKKNLFLIFIYILIIGCGFTPIYKDNKNLNINIKLIEDSNSEKFSNEVNLLNNYLKNELTRVNINNTSKQALVSFKTTYKKNSIVRDAKGKTTEYEIESIIKFLINFNNIEKNVTFKEKLNLNNMDDSLDESNYEKIIIKNFANSFSKKLILEIIKLNDN